MAANGSEHPAHGAHEPKHTTLNATSSVGVSKRKAPPQPGAVSQAIPNAPAGVPNRYVVGALPGTDTVAVLAPQSAPNMGITSPLTSIAPSMNGSGICTRKVTSKKVGPSGQHASHVPKQTGSSTTGADTTFKVRFVNTSLPSYVVVPVKHQEICVVVVVVDCKEQQVCTYLRSS